MYCYHGIAIKSPGGGTLANYFVECLSGNTVVPIYADGLGSPIASLSGVADRAKTDGRGNFFFYVADGTYNLKYYDDNGVYQFTETGFTMDAGSVALRADLAATTGAALVGSNDGAGGSLWTTVAGFVAKLLSSAGSSVIGHIQSGTGAVTRTIEAKLRDTIDLTDFAVGDGTTDDTTAVQACITAHAGKEIRLCGKTYIVSNVTLLSSSNFRGPGTIKRKAAATGIMVYGNAVTDVILDGVTFDGNSTGSVSQMVRLDGASHDLTVRGCTFKNSLDSGLAVSGSAARALIESNRFVSNANYGCAVDASGGSHVIEGNIARANGATGILVSAHYTAVVGNKAISNGAIVTNQAGILMLSCQYPIVTGNHALSNGTGALFSHGIQMNSCTNGVMQGNTSIANNGSGLDAYISTGTVIDGNQSLDNGLRGIEIDSGATYTAVTGNVVSGNAEVGISVFNTIGVTVEGNTVTGNGTLGTATNTLIGAANSPYGIAVWGAGSYGNYSRVCGNMISGNVGSGANGIGLYIHPSCVGLTVWANTLTGNTTNATIATGNLAFCGKNLGLYFEQAGAGTITSGNLSVAVSFSPALSFTPTASDIVLTPLQAATNAPGELYPTAVSASGFTLNCRNNPGASGLVVAWRVAKEAF